MSDAEEQPARSCDGCNGCCKPYSVAEVNKPAGTWCAHVLRGTGCAIYENRPGACRAYICGWLLGIGELDERPDKVKVVYTLGYAEITGSAFARMHELSPGALESPYGEKIRDLLLKKGYSVFRNPIRGTPRLTLLHGAYFTIMEMQRRGILTKDQIQHVVPVRTTP